MSNHAESLFGFLWKEAYSMEVLMGILLRAGVAVIVGVVCLIGLILYSKKKDREEAAQGKNTECAKEADAAGMKCSGDCRSCSMHHETLSKGS